VATEQVRADARRNRPKRVKRPSLRARVWLHARRPTEMVETTRWLFALLSLVSLVISLIAPLATARGVLLLAAVVSAVVLAASWAGGYVRRRAPLVLDVVDSIALLAFTLACPQPGVALGFVFSALWFRSLYGSALRAIVRCSLYVGALAGSLPLWPYVPGHIGGAPVELLVGSIPTMFLTVVVGRHLAGNLSAREQAARWDAVHVSLGSQLLGVTDADEVRRLAWVAMAGICAATPGLRVLKVVGDGALLSVRGATGGFVGVPAALPADVLAANDMDGGPDDGTIRSPEHLNAELGTSCDWVCLPLPEVHTDGGPAWLLIGTPGNVPAEAVVSIGSLANQVTLALRNSQTHRDLTVQATLDGLTGLPNRATFNAALIAALDGDSAGHPTVLFVDLDDFKDVNDEFGHGAGDQLLREVAARLGRATRPVDLCARLGGDEFAVLLDASGSAIAADIAQRIVTSVAAPVQLGGCEARVGASVGIATATSETDVEALIHRADVAMYAAKANGKARVQVFEPGLLQGNSAAAALERELAAAADNGELLVHYQPVLSLPGIGCVAAEALVRWQHPERGLLYPDSFIELAERTGAIRAIGAWVLRRACADATGWRDAHPGSPLSVHVNVSPLQLDDAGFFDVVIHTLQEFGLSPDKLVLEITESMVVSSPEAIARLNALALHGVTIAIDDFGTGYSALTTLRTLPVSIVKIDKSFIGGSTVNPEDRAVTEAVVKMAAQMGMRTIAEGVERLEQQVFLEGIGADCVQGYLYLRPTTAEKFGRWLDAHLPAVVAVEPATNVVAFVPRQSA
jgi:diguanylate cyclase (GGDEF)-like protein